MNWMTVAWPMVAASCATLGLIELRIALSEPPRAARLIFASSAFTSAAIAGLELAMMRTSNAPDWLFYAKATDVVVLLLIALLAAFILVYFGTGNRWLALATPALFAVGVVYDFVPGSDMTYLRIDGFREVETFGGASFFVANGVVNPADAFAYLGTTLLVIFVLDASIRLWRRGGRRRALVVGGSLAFFIVAGSVESAMVDAGIISLPYLISWSYLAFLFAMISELNADVLSATRLARDLREREQEMALAGEAAQLGMWRWDLQRDKIWATSRARALLGFSEGELIDAAKLLSALQPEDREALSRTVTGQDAPNREFEVEYRITHAEGGERWVASRGQIERNATGQPVYMRGVLADVSRRHDSEVELDQLRAQLRHASRVSMMGQLASALAHELSQPLGAILRNTEAAELFLLHDPPNLEELRAILTDIKEDDLRASGVIDRLRALLKHRTITPRAISLSDLLQAIRELTRIDAATRRATIEIDGASGIPAVMGDPVHLQQVLLNLVLNAIDAIDGLPTPRRMIKVRAKYDGGQEVEVSVTDSGHGIPPERFDQLFAPFFTTKASGLGVGLSISRTIIEAHGGRIWADVGDGNGATFRFTIPRAEEGSAA